MRRWPISRMKSLASRHRRGLTWASGVGVVLVSGLLLSQSFAASFSRYQTYRNGIASLRELESELSQEILRSRYELFASYDGLVTNLADQETLHRQLSDIPGFVGAGDRRTLLRVLQERQTALTQKEDLSEWFKSRNALLKNSLRYLPFLTRQIEASFDMATAATVNGAVPPEENANISPANETVDETVNGDALSPENTDAASTETPPNGTPEASAAEATAPNTATPETPTATSSENATSASDSAESTDISPDANAADVPANETPESNTTDAAPATDLAEETVTEANATPETPPPTPSTQPGTLGEQSDVSSTIVNALNSDQRETLSGTLNQLIRNLLLYNASGEAQVADQAEVLVQELATLENNLEIPQDVLPSRVFRSHANVILTTKPLVEELTGQLLLPLDQYTDDLETTLEQSYKRASRRTSLFRGLGLLWFLGLLIGGTRWYVRRSRRRDPAFDRYQQQVGHLATAAVQLQSEATWSQADSPLTPLLAREDDLGHLARHLQQAGDHRQQHQQAIQEEAFAFLTARLNLLTKNRRKLINADVAIALRSALETHFAEHGCTLLDLQLETDQVSITFRYPLVLSLANLVHQLKQVTANAMHDPVVATEPDLTNPDEIWSDAYLIASCPPPESTTPETLLANQGERS